MTHGISAFTAGYLITSDIQLSLYALLFGILSDLDFIVGIKHRSMTHSIVFLLSVSILSGMINGSIAVSAFIGIGMHIFLDMLTKQGVQLYWPLKKRVRIARLAYNEILANYAIILASLIILIRLFGIEAMSEFEKVLKLI